MLTWGPTFFENAFSVLKFLKVIFSFILHPLILRKSMCYGSRRGPLPNNTSCHLIAKLRKVIIILGGPDWPVRPWLQPPSWMSRNSAGSIHNKDLCIWCMKPEDKKNPGRPGKSVANEVMDLLLAVAFSRFL